MEPELDKMNWPEVLELLHTGQVPDRLIHKAIVRIAKPYNQRAVEASKGEISKFLEHPDAWVRHEALWFLASWASLREFKPQVIHALQHDADEDNRQFAAICLGGLESGTGDPESLRILGAVVLDQAQPEHVRATAYAAMLLVHEGEQATPRSDYFYIGGGGVEEADLAWVRSFAGKASG